eukprot:SAG11_NODE_2145_length_3754_cov_2.172914_2_plen_152_part_00
MARHVVRSECTVAQSALRELRLRMAFDAFRAAVTLQRRALHLGRRVRWRWQRAVLGGWQRVSSACAAARQRAAAEDVAEESRAQRLAVAARRSAQRAQGHARRRTELAFRVLLRAAQRQRRLEAAYRAWSRNGSPAVLSSLAVSYASPQGS